MFTIDLRAVRRSKPAQKRIALVRDSAVAIESEALPAVLIPGVQMPAAHMPAARGPVEVREVSVEKMGRSTPPNVCSSPAAEVDSSAATPPQQLSDSWLALAAAAEEQIQENPLYKSCSVKELLAKESGPFERERAVKIVIRACEELFIRGLPHGKLTPDSFQIYAGNEGDEVLFSQPIETTQKTAFSVYAAPELCAENSSDYLADVYSLGVILYELISNKSGSAAQIETFASDVSKWLAHSPVWSQTPSALKLIIRRCLNDEPCLRFRNARELQEALQNYLSPPKPAPSYSALCGNVIAIVSLFFLVLGIYQLSQFFGIESMAPAVPVASASASPNRPTASTGAALAATARPSSLGRRLLPLSAAESAGLSKYEIVVLLDCSSSMNDFDCPLAGIVTSRWDWACRQLGLFARQCSNSQPDGFTVFTYNDELRRFDHCGEQQLAQIRRTQKPGGDAQLAAALRLALSSHYGSNRPIAIVVLTSGITNDEVELERVISKATTRDLSRNSRLIFMTVGNAPVAHRLLNTIASFEEKQGNNSAALSAMPVRQVNHVGLEHVIAGSLRE